MIKIDNSNASDFLRVWSFSVIDIDSMPATREQINELYLQVALRDAMTFKDKSLIELMLGIFHPELAEHILSKYMSKEDVKYNIKNSGGAERALSDHIMEIGKGLGWTAKDIKTVAKEHDIIMEGMYTGATLLYFNSTPLYNVLSELPMNIAIKRSDELSL